MEVRPGEEGGLVGCGCGRSPDGARRHPGRARRVRVPRTDGNGGETPPLQACPPRMSLLLYPGDGGWARPDRPEGLMGANKPQRELPRPAPRLYVRVSRAEDQSNIAHDLDSMLGDVDVAAVLLRLPAGGERAMIEHAKVIAPVVQSKGIALILDGHPELVARAGADGAHMTGFDAFAAALDILKPARIAGAGGLKTRHDAMLAGEKGADYVMFGEPEPDGRRPSFAAIVERVVWWAELFEPPCVGFAGDLDEVAGLAAAGADFVAVDMLPAGACGTSLAKVAERLRAEPIRCG
jgi:thiamine-phosphate pyrophosphorylase